MRRSVKIWRAGLGWLCALLLAGGCVPLDGGDLPDEQVAGFVPTAPDTAAGDGLPTPGLTGDEFADAGQLQPSPGEQTVQLSDALDPASARKLYNLGVIDSGTHLWIELASDPGSELCMALLDQDRRLLAMAESDYAGNARLDLVLQAPASPLFLVVAAGYAMGTRQPYTLQTASQNGWLPPDPQPQVVVLQHLGGSQVRVGSRYPVDIPAFDAARIDPKFAGATDRILARVLDLVREDFQGLGVQVFLAGAADFQTAEQTDVYLGTYDARLLGLADNIDPYNTDPTQTAVVFTDTFSLFSILNPDEQDIAQVLANVISHELGHLLGLRHTADIHDLMDVTATARQMLADQWFGTARLHASVLPVGFQDSPTLLSWSVGGTLQMPVAGKVITRQSGHVLTKGYVDDFPVDRTLLAVSSDSDLLLDR